jgi:hypothetical protein
MKDTSGTGSRGFGWANLLDDLHLLVILFLWLPVFVLAVVLELFTSFEISGWAWIAIILFPALPSASGLLKRRRRKHEDPQEPRDEAAA